MSEQIYLITLLIIAGTFILVFGMRVLAARQDARARTSKEEAYRELAARAATAQAEAAARLADVMSEVSGVNARLAAVEKMLRDVG